MLYGVKRPEQREEVFEASSEKDALILAHETYPETSLKDFEIRQLFEFQIVQQKNLNPFQPVWPYRLGDVIY